MNESRGTVYTTCDSCAEGGECTLDIDGICYICESCAAFDNRAIMAAADAVWVEEHERGEGIDPIMSLRLASTAIRAYLEYSEEEDGAE